MSPVIILFLLFSFCLEALMLTHYGLSAVVLVERDSFMMGEAAIEWLRSTLLLVPRDGGHAGSRLLPAPPLTAAAGQ